MPEEMCTSRWKVCVSHAGNLASVARLGWRPLAGTLAPTKLEAAQARFNQQMLHRLQAHEVLLETKERKAQLVILEPVAQMESLEAKAHRATWARLARKASLVRKVKKAEEVGTDPLRSLSTPLCMFTIHRYMDVLLFAWHCLSYLSQWATPVSWRSPTESMPKRMLQQVMTGMRRERRIGAKTKRKKINIEFRFRIRKRMLACRVYVSIAAELDSTGKATFTIILVLEG